MAHGQATPRWLIFIAPSLLEYNKMEKLLQSSLEMRHLEPQNESANNNEAAAITKSTEPSGRINNASDQELTSQENIMAVDSIMCSPPKKRRKTFDEEAIVMGNELTDIEINFTQCLQFKNVRGLESTLLQERNSASSISKDAIKIEFRFFSVKSANTGWWPLLSTVLQMK